MSDKLVYLTVLQAAIQQVHECEAVYARTVPVHETIGGQTVWKGEVEVFDLDGHAEAKKCYAWSFHEPGDAMRHVTVLEKQPVNSPEMAVRSAIFFNVQPTPFPRPSLPS